MLYMKYLRDEIDEFSTGLSTRKQKYFDDFKQNLREGIDYYQNLPESSLKGKWNGFIKDLKSLCEDLEALTLDTVVSA